MNSRGAGSNRPMFDMGAIVRYSTPIQVHVLDWVDYFYFFRVDADKHDLIFQFTYLDLFKEVLA